MSAMARKRKTCKSFTKRAMWKGARTEKREHRLSWKMAFRIARDHLCENPRYYGRSR